MFRLCGLRFALCPRGFSRFAASDESRTPLLIGLTTACFRHRRRPSCAPYQFPLKSCGFSSAETARKRFLLWKMGFSDAAHCTPMHPLNSAWSSHTFAPPCANACAVFRPCGLRFAPCPRGSSRFAASDARKLTCGTPCFIGLTTACFAHCARPSCAPKIFLPLLTNTSRCDIINASQCDTSH